MISAVAQEVLGATTVEYGDIPSSLLRRGSV